MKHTSEKNTSMRQERELRPAPPLGSGPAPQPGLETAKAKQPSPAVPTSPPLVVVPQTRLNQPRTPTVLDDLSPTSPAGEPAAEDPEPPRDGETANQEANRQPERQLARSDSLGSLGSLGEIEEDLSSRSLRGQKNRVLRM